MNIGERSIANGELFIGLDVPQCCNSHVTTVFNFVVHRAQSDVRLIAVVQQVNDWQEDQSQILIVLLVMIVKCHMSTRDIVESPEKFFKAQAILSAVG